MVRNPVSRTKAKKRTTSGKATKTAKSGDKAQAKRKGPHVTSAVSVIATPEQWAQIEAFNIQSIVKGYVNSVPFSHTDKELEEFCDKQIREFNQAKKEYERKHHALRTRARQFEETRIRKMIKNSDVPISLWLTDADGTVRAIAEKVAFERKQS